MAEGSSRPRRPLRAPPWLVALSVCAAIGSVSWVAWDGYACTAEQNEAIDSLMKLQQLEQAYKNKKGSFTPMDACSFTAEGRTCVSRLGFTIVGDSRYAYRVEVNTAGDQFLATAVGARGRHFGSVITIDHTGKLDMSGAVCRD